MPRDSAGEEGVAAPAEPRRLRVAYHEAGHAVVLLALGGTFESLSITGDHRALGRVRGPHVPGERPGSERPCAGACPPLCLDHGLTQEEVMAVALLAGSHAERRAMGTWHRRAGEHDRREARRLLERYGAARVNNALPAAEHLAEQLLARDWDAVERVAAALREQGELELEQVRGLFASGEQKGER